MSNFFLDLAKRSTLRFLLPFVRFLASVGVRPLFLTFVAFLFVLLCIFFFSQPVLFILFGSLHLLCDLFDGALARFLGQESRLGKQFDAFSDRVIEGLLLFVAPVSFPLSLFSLGFFFLQLLFFSFIPFAFYARSLLFFFFVFGFFTPGVVAALVLYCAGILVQLFLLVRRTL